MMGGRDRDRSVAAVPPAQFVIGATAWLLALAIIVLSISPAAAAIRPHDDLRCLALTIYFEARGEPQAGKLAVASVVMNRVADRRFPDRLCDVVRQGGAWPKNRCQFSWWCDGRSDRPINDKAWSHSRALALLVYWGFFRDPTEGALWYHADYVRPIWHKAFQRGPKIGSHIFYRPTTKPGRAVQASYERSASY